MHSDCLFKLKYKPKHERTRNGCNGYGRSDFRERKTSFSLDFQEIRSSEFIGIHRDEKESCSTHRGLRVGSDFKEFRQTL